MHGENPPPLNYTKDGAFKSDIQGPALNSNQIPKRSSAVQKNRNFYPGNRGNSYFHFLAEFP